MSGLPLNINFQQIFLHMMNFVILAGGLYFILYKPVRRFMDKRAEYYASIDKNTREVNEEAKKLKEQHDELLKEADAEAEEIKRQARLEGEGIISEAKLKAADEKDRIIAEAKVKAEKEKEKIINSAKDEIIELVIDAERKILTKESGDEQ